MKKTLLMVAVLALSSFAMADDAALLAEMPVGSILTIALPGAIVHASENSLNVPIVNKESSLSCHLGFNSSSQDRILEAGTLSLTTTSLPYGDEVPGTLSYGGKPMSANLICDYQDQAMTIGKFRRAVENAGGSLMVSPPIPF